MRRGGDAGVAFCWPGVGAILSIFVVLRVFSRSLDPKDRSAPAPLRPVRFVPSQLARFYPSATAARSPGNDDKNGMGAWRGSPGGTRTSFILQDLPICLRAIAILLCNLLQICTSTSSLLPSSIRAAFAEK